MPARHDPDRRLLSREIDDLLLHVRGLVLVREVLEDRGVSEDELDAHTRELERLRGRLARLIEGPRGAGSIGRPPAVHAGALTGADARRPTRAEPAGGPAAAPGTPARVPAEFPASAAPRA
jgi:hypothetical protein